MEYVLESLKQLLEQASKEKDGLTELYYSYPNLPEFDDDKSRLSLRIFNLDCLISKAKHDIHVYGAYINGIKVEGKFA